MNVKLIAAVAALAAMTGCASHPQQTASQSDNAVYVNGMKTYQLQGYRGPEAMDSNEVVQASKQCITHKMRPNVSYLSVRTDQGKVLVPVSVICEPF